MKERDEIKQHVIEAIDNRREDLINIGRRLYAMPETGFREHRTAAYTEELLHGLGLEVESGIALTGLKSKAKGRSHGNCVAVMGELDALMMPAHCHADPVTGVAHACGHHAQLAMVIGVAAGLIEGGAMQYLDGDVAFLAVPAEEVIELAMRGDLASQGKIRFFGGKQEFIRLGVFDDIDAVLCGHLSNTGEISKFQYGASYNGVINKIVEFIGKSSHAAWPHLGVNALQAAINAVNIINSIRETLPESEYARIHYIITKGGDSPNIIPDDVLMEFGVRAASSDFMLALNKRVNQALRSAAESIGARVDIRDMGAYLPAYPDEAMCQVFARNAEMLLGKEYVIHAANLHRCSSTDMGDVASVRPTMYQNFGGAAGSPHTVEFDVVDEDFAYVEPAKAMAMSVIDLLWDNANELNAIKAGYVPVFANKAAYLDYFDRLFGSPV